MPSEAEAESRRLCLDERRRPSGGLADIGQEDSTAHPLGIHLLKHFGKFPTPHVEVGSEGVLLHLEHPVGLRTIAHVDIAETVVDSFGTGHRSLLVHGFTRNFVRAR